MLLISGEPAGSWHTIYKYINHEKGVMQTVFFLVFKPEKRKIKRELKFSFNLFEDGNK